MAKFKSLLFKYLFDYEPIVFYMHKICHKKVFKQYVKVKVKVN